MSDKLTLRIEQKLIQRAKKYASKKGTSVSKLVADYFQAIDAEESESNLSLPPVTKALSGILNADKVTEDDYKAHLADKYLK